MTAIANSETTLTVDVTRNEDGSFTAAISKPGNEHYDGTSDESEIHLVAKDMAELVRDAIVEAFSEPMEFTRAVS